METTALPGAPTGSGLGKHYYQFYKGPEDFFRAVVPFLKVGLESGEACLWTVSKLVGVLEAIETLQHQCDLIRFLKNGQLLVVPAERWYWEGVHFSGRKALQRLEKFIQERKRRGFSVFRMVGDVGLLDREDWSELQVYEEKARQCMRSLAVITICTYPIHQCSISQTKDILEHHDGVFLTKL